MSSHSDKTTEQETTTEQKSERKLYAHPAVLALFMLAVVLVVGVIYCGSPGNLLRQLSGVECYAPETTIDVGTLPSESVHEFKIVLNNTSRQEISIVGMDKSCGCLRGDGNLPKPIAANGSLEIVLEVVPKGRISGTAIDESLSFFVNRQREPVFVRVIGKVE